MREVEGVVVAELGMLVGLDVRVGVGVDDGLRLGIAVAVAVNVGSGSGCQPTQPPSMKSK